MEKTKKTQNEAKIRFSIDCIPQNFSKKTEAKSLINSHQRTTKGARGTSLCSHFGSC